MQESSIKPTKTIELPSGKKAIIKAYISLADKLAFDDALLGNHALGSDEKITYRDLYRLHKAWIEKLLIEYDGQSNPAKYLLESDCRLDYDFILSEIDKLIDELETDQEKKLKAGSSNTIEPSA